MTAQCGSPGTPGYGFAPFITGSNIDWAHIPNDAVLPSQFYRTVARSEAQHSGEWKLRSAVLESALGDLAFCGKNPTQAIALRHAADAWQWIFDDADANLTFAACCETLGLEPSAVRRALLGSHLCVNVRVALNAWRQGH